MSYVGLPFTQDLFLSYSHGSDGAGNSWLQAWSVAFAKALESELRVEPRFRENLKLFIDKDYRQGQGVDPLEPLSDQLQEHIGNSALLVVLMSPDYVTSKWCKLEREWWHQRQSDSGAVSGHSRIAVVRTMPILENQWPDQFKDSAGNPPLGFLFHVSIENLVRPLGYLDLPGEFGKEFKRALLGLVGHLYIALDKTKNWLDERRRAQEDSKKLAEEGGQTVYLHGRAEHAPLWTKRAEALGEKGFAVVPGEPERMESDPKRQQKVREQRVELMSGCDALLLLGTEDGYALDADLVTLGKHDRHSARARSMRLLPCGVLDTVGKAIATDVRRRTARALQTDWLDGTQPEWPAAVAQWLKDKSAQARLE